ncbi:MAG: hypothetical protein NVSMB9_35600 [Isosphaeraceae bacterium]
MKRVLELDALRGIAAVVIILAHVGLMVDSPWVFSAVDLFFVLSGYFITTNILKNRRAPGFLGVFFTRRALRIWPAYYVALGACLLLNRSLKWDSPPDAWPYYLTFTQNIQAYAGWVLPRFSGMFIHTWTLAIEEQFYILWPLLLFRGGRRSVVAVILTFAVLPLLGRSLGYSPFLLLTRCDGLALGSLLAVVLSDRAHVSRQIVRYRVAFALIGLTALVLPPLAGPALAEMARDWSSPAWGRIGPALFTTRACVVYFGLGGLTICLQGHRALGFLRDRRLCYLGTVSYGLYLYHPLVFASLPGLYKRLVFRRLGLTSTFLMDLVMLAVCFLLAELSRRYIEGPVLAFKERLSYTARIRDNGGDATYRGPHASVAAPLKSERAVETDNRAGVS